MKLRVYDIKWFYNYGDHSDYLTKEDYDETFYAEPTEIIYDLDDDNWIEDCQDEEEIQDRISNVISDDSGYYHEGFSWEILNQRTMKGEIELMIEYYENELNNHNYTPEQITNSLWENEESLGEYEGDIDSYFDAILPQVEELMSKRNLVESN